MHNIAIEQLSRRCLVDIGNMIDRYLAEVREIPSYAAGAVPRGEIVQDVAASFELVLRLVGELPVPEHLEQVSESLGRRRARLGVPLEQLLQALRLDFDIVWQSMLKHASADERAEMLSSAPLIWRAVERHTLRTQAGYLEEKDLQARQRDYERGALLRSLLESGGGDSDVCKEVATALHGSESSKWLVVVSSLHDTSKIKEACRCLLLAGRSAHAEQFRDRTVLVVETVGRNSSTVASHLQDLSCGMALAECLADVPRAWEVARAIVEAKPSVDGGYFLRDVWDRVAAKALGTLRDAFIDTVLGEMTSASPNERLRIEETVRAYLRSGSTSDVAKRLYCHRNTVLNRLDRFSELTGYDVTNPRDAAAVALALAATDVS